MLTYERYAEIVSVLTGAVDSCLDYLLSVNNNLRLIVEGARTLHDNEQEYVLNLIKLLNSKH